MRAVVITRPGGPEVLDVREVPAPDPAPSQVLVRVHAAGLNRADVLQRIGRYPAPAGYPADIPGIEFAGEIARVGADVTAWSEGDRVFGITGGGAHAQWIVAEERSVSRIPPGLPWTEAAAIPEAFITAHDALCTQGRLAPGESLLIHAVASGVGLAAAQLGRARGARVFGTSRQAHKLHRAYDFGLDEGYLAGEDLATLPAAAQTFTAGRGFDLTLDLLGGPYLAASVACAAHRGRLMLVGALAGASATLDVRQVLGKRLTLQGTVLRTRSPTEKAAATTAFAREVLPLLAGGQIRPIVDRVFALDDIGSAHEYMESNDAFGKIVLAMP